MRLMRRRSVVVFPWICAFLLVLMSGLVRAQSSSSPLDMLKNLSPDQQDAIMQALGGSGGGLPTGVGTGTGASESSTDMLGRLRQQGNRTGSQSDLQSNQQLLSDREREKEKEEEITRISPLKGGEWVIIEIDYHLPPRPLSGSLQALYMAQGVSQAQLQALQQNALTGTVTPQAALAGAASQAGPIGTGNVSGTAVSEAQLTEEQRLRNEQMMNLIRSRNPYQLSADGVLSLPGIPGIHLAGLNEDDATLRLKAEPAFNNLDVRLTHLTLKKTGLEALKPFGYDLFERAPSTFAPVTNVPVPADYVVGPGDVLEVQLYGNQNRALRLTVGRDGTVNFPELGPINVVGQLFNSVRSSIEARVQRQIIGVRASVSMYDTRSIRVFVLGEAQQPGSYTISGLGTITSALFAAGGVKKIGSLRNIELKRQGELIRKLDLYDLLIHGNTSDDTKLLPGDVIFIPPVGRQVSVMGEVRRPAIYEVKAEANVDDLLQLAGGLTAEADRSRVTLTRIDAQQRRVILNVDTATPTGKSQAVSNGDLLQVARLRSNLDSGIQIQGYVYTPGAIAYRDGLRLSDVIHSVDELQPDADIHYVLIRRELPPNRRIAVVSADLAAALASPGSKADVTLMPRDRIIVFDLATGRDRTIQTLMDELRVQSNIEAPTQVVHVDGRVKVPGDYPLEPGMTVRDLIRAGGGLSDAAYVAKAELTRYEVVNGETRRTNLIEVDLNAATSGDPAANLALKPFDNLSIKEVSEWRGQESVTLTGEVRFPGHYSIRRGETLRSVIARAGGLTDYAFADGSVFTRTELRRREQEQLDALAARMQKDLAILAVQATATSTNGQGGNSAAAALSVGQQLFTQLRAARAVGRLVIDLKASMKAAPGSNADLIMRNGDELIVPRLQQEVTVIGEVQNSTSHLYNAGLGRDDYISLSGGMTRRADRHSIYVVRANGSVVANQGNRWFQQGGYPMRPGDTVVVPLDAEHMPPLPYWQAVTSILYNVAIAVAAVHAL
jgi:protein involved in polysaccharide export with SLBB domain